MALGSETVFRAEVALGAFYGALLILLPAYRGIVNGRLPSSISARGAEFADAVDASVQETELSIAELQERTPHSKLKLRLTATRRGEVGTISATLWTEV